MAFAFDFILKAVRWRWTFRIAAIPGFFMAVVMFITIREPSRTQVRGGQARGHGDLIV